MHASGLSAGAKGPPGSAAVCWTLGILCGLLLALDVPAKFAWLDETADAFDAAIIYNAVPAALDVQRGRASSSSPQSSPSQRQGNGRFAAGGERCLC